MFWKFTLSGRDSQALQQAPPPLHPPTLTEVSLLTVFTVFESFTEAKKKVF